MENRHIHSHFGVYALIIRTGTEVLLIKKARGPYTGMYDLPGGTPESLELLEETLVREVGEETSCTVLRFSQLGTFSTRFDYMKEGRPATLRHLGSIYTCDIEGEPTLEADMEDSGGCLWLSIEQVSEQNSTPFVRDSLAAAGYLDL